MLSTFLRRFKQLPKLLFSALMAFICCKKRRECKNCKYYLKEDSKMAIQDKSSPLLSENGTSTTRDKTNDSDVRKEEI